MKQSDCLSPGASYAYCDAALQPFKTAAEYGIPCMLSRTLSSPVSVQAL